MVAPIAKLGTAGEPSRSCLAPYGTRRPRRIAVDARRAVPRALSARPACRLRRRKKVARRQPVMWGPTIPGDRASSSPPANKAVAQAAPGGRVRPAATSASMVKSGRMPYRSYSGPATAWNPAKRATRLQPESVLTWVPSRAGRGPSWRDPRAGRPGGENR